MDYQIYKPITKTRQSNKQKPPNGNSFSKHNYKFVVINNINRQITKPPYTRHQNQSQEQYYNQQIPQQALHSVFFNGQQRTTTDRCENYPFLQQNKI